MYGFIEKGILMWLENEESKAQHCQQLNIIFSFFPWKKKIKKNDNMHALNACMHVDFSAS